MTRDQIETKIAYGPDDGAEFIGIESTEHWDAFWSDNEDALTDAVGDEKTCRRLAMNCDLMVGGGAGPLFRVGFVD